MTALTGADGRFSMRVPPGRSSVFPMGPMVRLRGVFHYATWTAPERETWVIKVGGSYYSRIDPLDFLREDQERLTTSNGRQRFTTITRSARPSYDFSLKQGQTLGITFGIQPLEIRTRPDGKSDIFLRQLARPKPRS